MDLKSFGTVAGASAATILIVNTIQQATGWNERWFPLVVAIGVCVFGRFMAKAKTTVIEKVGNGLMMGFIVFSTSFAGQNALIAASPEQVTFMQEQQSIVEMPMPLGSPPAYETRTRLVPRHAIVPEPERTFRSSW